MLALFLSSHLLNILSIICCYWRELWHRSAKAIALAHSLLLKHLLPKSISKEQQQPRYYLQPYSYRAQNSAPWPKVHANSDAYPHQSLLPVLSSYPSTPVLLRYLYSSKFLLNVIVSVATTTSKLSHLITTLCMKNIPPDWTIKYFEQLASRVKWNKSLLLVASPSLSSEQRSVLLSIIYKSSEYANVPDSANHQFCLGQTQPQHPITNAINTAVLRVSWRPS